MSLEADLRYILETYPTDMFLNRAVGELLTLFNNKLKEIETLHEQDKQQLRLECDRLLQIKQLGVEQLMVAVEQEKVKRQILECQMGLRIYKEEQQEA